LQQNCHIRKKMSCQGHRPARPGSRLVRDLRVNHGIYARAITRSASPASRRVPRASVDQPNAGIVDDIGVVAGAAGQRVGATATGEAVVVAEPLDAVSSIAAQSTRGDAIEQERDGVAAAHAQTLRHCRLRTTAPIRQLINQQASQFNIFFNISWHHQ
jgi:hypothetical protein